ncbi:metallopeptidase [Bacillus phage vB_BpuM-BpSp]|nr:metallopeptidase [Bacillus phage vB_BpuM-BpSp]
MNKNRVESNGTRLGLYEEIKKVYNRKELVPVEDSIKNTKEINKYFSLLITSLILENENGENKFFAFFMSNLRKEIVHDPKFAPAAVNYDDRARTFNLFLNPYKMFLFSEKEIIAVLIHELLHIANNHIYRYRILNSSVSSKDMHRVNIAMDCAINQYIPNLPDGLITLDYVKKVTEMPDLEAKREFEYYYEILKEKGKEQDKMEQEMMDQLKEKLKEQMEGNDQDSSGEGESSENQSGSGQQGDGSEGENSENGKGSGGGNPNEITDDDVDSNGQLNQSGKNKRLSNSHDPHSLWNGNSSEKMTEKEMNDIIQKILEDSRDKNKGNTPSNISEIIARLKIQPEIPWQKILKNKIGSLKVPYRRTNTRKNRRQPHRADILGRMPDRECNITVAIDMSGSMSDKEVMWAFGEIFSIISGRKSKITVVHFDTEVGSVYPIKDKRDVVFKRDKSGGTYFSPAIKYINDKIKNNDITIVFTDGYGEAELVEKPKSHVIWVLTEGNQGGGLSLNKPYGEVRSIKPKK